VAIVVADDESRVVFLDASGRLPENLNLARFNENFESLALQMRLNVCNRRLNSR